MKQGFNQVICRRGARRSFPAAVVALMTVVLAGALPAVAMAAATVAGTPRQGKTLTATFDPTTDPTPTNIQWLRCGSSCTAIAGQTSLQYTLTADDVGFQIEVSDHASAPSAATAVVFPVLFPTVIAGSRAEGQTLEAVAQWSAAPPSTAAVGFSWSRCNATGGACVPGPGASGAQYHLSAGDVGHTIMVVATDNEPTPAQTNSATTSTIADAGAATTTAIVTSPASASTNQSVTLIGTVTAAASDKSPSGTVKFANRGLTIPGCGSVPASSFGQSVTVTCTTSFPAASSAEQLTAAFIPNSNSGVTGSTSAPTPLTIRPDSTTSAVDVSKPTVALGHAATFTATVQGSLAGAVKPSGTVEFFDQGKPIAPCAKQPLAAATVGSGASCVVRYQSTGSHAITVAYPGDANFTGSGSQFATPVSARRIAVGTVSSTMQWSFRVTRSYTRVLALMIDSVSAGTNVAVSCQGKGCPFARRSTTIHQTTRCVTKGKSKGKTKGKRKCTIQRARSVDLQPGFSRRRVHPGARITIFLTRPQFVGKYYQFSIRPSGSPRIRIACLAPGSTTPGVGC